MATTHNLLTQILKDSILTDDRSNQKMTMIVIRNLSSTNDKSMIRNKENIQIKINKNKCLTIHITLWTRAEKFKSNFLATKTVNLTVHMATSTMMTIPIQIKMMIKLILIWARHKTSIQNHRNRIIPIKLTIMIWAFSRISMLISTVQWMTLLTDNFYREEAKRDIIRSNYWL